MSIAEVVVDIKNKAVDRIFDYHIPDQLKDVAHPGVRVSVPFGPRTLVGFIISTKEKTEFSGKLRSITKVMDMTPVLNEELLQLGINLSKETGATMISCFEAMIPAAMKAKYKKYFCALKKEEIDSQLAALFEKTDKVLENIVAEELIPVLKREIAKNNVEVIYEISEKLGKKMQRYVELVQFDFDLSLISRSKKQTEVVEKMIQNKKPIAKNELDASDAVLKGLEKKGIIRFIEVEIYRDPYKTTHVPQTAKKQLNEEQKQAVTEILATDTNVILLHGVTGSGKTEVYLESIEKVVKNGKDVLVLIPEITLTTQLTARFKARFGELVAVMHSGLSVGEKYDEWRKVLRGEVKIVIGARSAVFAPFRNIGLIIIDEEHESTFKQDEMPRYHAIEVAKARAEFHECPVLLGSATPSLESYARAKKGVYKLIELSNRAVATADKPIIKLIDLNYQTISNQSSVISTELQNAIDERLKRKEQVILFLNRRGYSNYMQCRECHEVVNCPNCDVTLTYHKQFRQLRCHYCSHQEQIATECPKCQSVEIRFFGTGTQKIEEFLNERYTSAKILRMDVDTTTGKGDHERIIKSFENKKADILIGTQMVAKGLDFPGVTLVGVIDGDMMLHFPDFKASERTFQILTQVAGRSGRHIAGGEVYIETYSTNHYVMKCVKTQNYQKFYEEEMKMRRLFRYSPYFFHAVLLLTSSEPDALLVTSEKINAYLREKLKDECLIIGPTMPSIARLNNRFRMNFIVKYKKSPNLKETIKYLLENVDQTEVSIAADYFPVHLI